MEKNIFLCLVTLFFYYKKCQESTFNVLYLTQCNRNAFNINFPFFTVGIISKVYDRLFLTNRKLDDY